MRTNDFIQIKIFESDKKIISSAAKKLALGVSTFCKMSALEKARHILKENKEEAVQQAG